MRLSSLFVLRASLGMAALHSSIFVVLGSTSAHLCNFAITDLEIAHCSQVSDWCSVGNLATMN